MNLKELENIAESYKLVQPKAHVTKLLNEAVLEIKALGERCLQLGNDKGNLIDDINQMKADVHWAYDNFCEEDTDERIGQLLEKWDKGVYR